MTRILLGLVLAGGALLATREGGACGDKFLVIGRGVRQQRALGAVHRASILVYLDSKGQLEAALREARVETQLRLAGHTLRSVDSRAQLAERLASGKYDIVLAPLSEMTTLEQSVGSGPTRPFLLPVIHNPTGEELAEAEAEFSCVMRSPSTKKHYLAVIDEAMALRKKGRNP
jgi:hypothetical protein